MSIGCSPETRLLRWQRNNCLINAQRILGRGPHPTMQKAAQLLLLTVLNNKNAVLNTPLQKMNWFPEQWQSLTLYTFFCMNVITPVTYLTDVIQQCKMGLSYTDSSLAQFQTGINHIGVL